MAKPDIWMPLYIGDYLADTMHLTTEQHGAYLLLIMAYWRNGGPLLSEDQSLAAISKLSADAWSMHKHVLASFFDTESSPGEWILPRAEKEMQNAGNNQEKRTLRAQKAAAARWGNDAPSNATSNAQAMLGECPSPSPSHNKTSSLRSDNTQPKKKPANKAVVTLAQLVAEGCKEDHARDWLAVRTKHRAPLTPTAWEAVKAQAAAARITPARAVQVAAENGWRGFKSSWYAGDIANGKPNTGGNRQGGVSLVDQVRNHNAEQQRLRDIAHEPIPGTLEWDVEFERVDEADGKLVAPDD